MNPAAQPGQMAPGQANVPRPGAPQGVAQHRPTLFRPEHMRTINALSDPEKIKYEQGLRGLWTTVQNNPRGSPAQLEAQKKIAEFSQQLVVKIRSRGNAPPGGQPQMPQMPQLPQQGQLNPQAGADQNTGAADTAPPAATPQPAQATAASGGTNTQPQAQPQQPGTRPLNMTLTPQVRRHLEQMTWLPPQNIADQGPEAVAKWTAGVKERYTKAVMQMTVTVDRVKALDTFIKQLQQKGPGLSAEEQQKLQEGIANKNMTMKAHNDAKTYVENFRREQNAFKEARSQSTGESQDATTTTQPVRPGPSPQQPANNSSITQASATTDATKAQQAGVPGPAVPNANDQAVQQPSQPQVQPQAPASAPPQASPVPTAPSAAGVGSQQQIKIEPGTQQHAPPPPVNTSIASAAAAGLPSAGTPTQNSVGRIQTPQTATPTTGPPRSLSHSAALNLANQSRSQPGSLSTQTPQQSTPQIPGGTPSSAGVMGTAQPQPGHPHAHPTQQPQTTLSQKLPIVKTLPEKATQPPQPVSTSVGGVTPGRPTYTQGGGSTGGVMGQPVLPKIPVVQMEGEGERVLNRKKLDDLVRQVCGGQAEGQEGNALTPDVEEVSYPTNENFSNKPFTCTSLYHLTLPTLHSTNVSIYKLLMSLSLDHPQHGRRLCRPPNARGLLQCEAAWFKSPRNSRHTTRAGTYIQHSDPRIFI